MELVFACEGHFVKNAQGEYYSENGGFTNQLWNRYLFIFSHILVIARVKVEASYYAKEALRADNEKVSFVDLPDYVGPMQYLKARRRIKQLIKKEMVPGRAYLCRLPGTIGGEVISVLKRREMPYGVEVVGDPWDVFAPGAFKHPLRMVLRYQGYWGLKKGVKYAMAVLYVTKEQLQKRYPALEARWIGNASNVMIKSESVPPQAHVLRKKERYELISVGSLAQMYKAPDVVIQALVLLKERGVNVHVTWLGDGVYKENMQEYAHSLGVGDMITFAGAVSMETVAEYLRASDIFILVSRTEGLPRALIEAMAEGLPCVATNVGGIPELLEDAMLIPKNDAKALADKVAYLLRDIEEANRQAEVNYLQAKDYYDVVLQKRRNDFYRHLATNSK